MKPKNETQPSEHDESRHAPTDERVRRIQLAIDKGDIELARARYRQPTGLRTDITVPEAI